MSIAGFDVNVEPYIDLDAIGILNADIAQGTRPRREHLEHFPIILGHILS